MERMRFRPLFLALPVLVALGCGQPPDPPQKVMGELQSLLQGEQFPRAAALARENLKLYPRSARLKLALARAEFASGHYPEVLQVLNPVLSEGWEGAGVNGLLGSSYFYLGDMKKAREFLQKIPASSSDDRELLKQLGYASYYERDGRAALEIFGRLKESDPNDLESYLVQDALMGLTGKWPATWMSWTTDPVSGMQICYPGAWERKQKEELGPAGKMVWVRFMGKPFSREGRFLPGGVMLLAAYQNASKFPLPKQLKGSFRPGEETEEGRWYYATRPGAQPTFASVPREPGALAQTLSRDALKSLLEAWDCSVRSVEISPWSGVRGKAHYCFGEAVGQDAHGWEYVGRSMGVYDSYSDTFGFLVLYGPYLGKEDVRALSKAVFHLALFGGVVGIPPAMESRVSAQDYEARIRGFLQGGQAPRAATEAGNALKAHPDVGVLHALLGEAEETLWHPKEAVASYEEARRRDYSTFRLETALGFLRLGMGQPVLAEQAFSRALTLEPSHPQALAGMGLSSYWQGRVDQARHWFERTQVEAPSLKSARYLTEAMKSLQPETESDLLYWFELENGKGRFCVPVHWVHRELEREGGLYRVFFSAAKEYPEVEDVEAGLLYIRYESASRRAGRIEKKAKPDEVVDEFLRQSYDQLQDPQKVWQQLSPIYERSGSRFALGGYSYTHLSRRRDARILSYYEPGKDRLHVLLFRVSSEKLEEWAPFIESCFQTAKFE